MLTLVPTNSFEKDARRLLDEREYDGLLQWLARNPMAGPVIKGTGGLRKVRIARQDGGKSGGVRVIYYFHAEDKPILLLLIYAKASQQNLTARQKRLLRKLVTGIYGEIS